MRVDIEHDHLIHKDDVLTNQFRKFISQQRLRRAPISLAAGCRAIAQIQEHLMLLSMAFAQRASRSRDQGGFMDEMTPHDPLQPSELKGEPDLLAVHGLEPA